MNILLVIDGLEFGGGDRLFLQLAIGMNKKRNIHIIASPDREFQRKVAAAGINFIPVDMSRRFSWKSIKKIQRIILTNKIQIVHTQGTRADFYGRIAGKIAGVEGILSTIQMPVEGFDVSPLRKKIYRFFDWITERYVKHFIVVSDTLKQLLTEKRRIPLGKVIKIYNGIELDHYIPGEKNQNLRNELLISYNTPIIGCIGRMVWQKGFEYLIKAIPDIAEQIPDARFVFIGDGPVRSQLEQLANLLNLSGKVIFTGFRSDIKEILSEIDILVVPSLLEGFPMITLEAMAMAKPIIATNIPGISEQITDQKEGILIPPENAQAITGAVCRLIADRPFAQKLGKAARQKVQTCFSVEKMVKETENVYLSLLHG